MRALRKYKSIGRVYTACQSHEDSRDNSPPVSIEDVPEDGIDWDKIAQQRWKVE